MTHADDDHRDLSFQLCVLCNHRCSEALHEPPYRCPDCDHAHRPGRLRPLPARGGVPSGLVRSPDQPDAALSRPSARILPGSWVHPVRQRLLAQEPDEVRG